MPPLTTVPTPGDTLSTSAQKINELYYRMTPSAAGPKPPGEYTTLRPTAGDNLRSSLVKINALLQLIYDSGGFGGTTTLPPSSLGVFIETPSNKTYTLELEAGGPYTITKLSIKTVSGTCTAALQRNATAISGAGSVAVSPTLSDITLNQAVAQGDSITLAISANASAADLSASVRIQP